MPVPYVILKERYIPRMWNAWRIGRDLTRLTQELGFIPLNDPEHGPQAFRAWCSKKLHAECGWVTYKGNQGEDWHQDGDLAAGSKMDNAMVLWANRTPTEFRFGGTIYQPKPFQVIIVKNLSCHHRRPADAPKRRWLFRQRVEVPKHLDLSQ
jgi:hypothetical protein